MDDAHITAINKLADKLEKRQSADELVTVRQRREQLNNRSVSLSTSSPSAASSVLHKCVFVVQVEQVSWRSKQLQEEAGGGAGGACPHQRAGGGSRQSQREGQSCRAALKLKIQFF